MVIDDNEPLRLLGPLPPECDVPIDLPDYAVAVRTMDGWHANTDSVPRGLEHAMYGLEVVRALRQTAVGNLPQAVLVTLSQTLAAGYETLTPRLGVAVVLSLSRLIKSRGGRICIHQLGCEAFRVTSLAMIGHVRRTLRVQHPEHDYWRQATVEPLFSSCCSAFYGGPQAELRLLNRVGAPVGVPEVAAAGAVVGQMFN